MVEHSPLVTRIRLAGFGMSGTSLNQWLSWEEILEPLDQSASPPTVSSWQWPSPQPLFASSMWEVGTTCNRNWIFFGEISGISFSPDAEALFVGVWDCQYGSLFQYNRRRNYSYLHSLLWGRSSLFCCTPCGFICFDALHWTFKTRSNSHLLSSWVLNSRF